jgi:hypothetical protein
MKISEWVRDLSDQEKGYVRQCWNYWHGGADPVIPDGISKPKADILKYHTKSFIDENNGRKRKMEDLRIVSLKMTQDQFDRIANSAAQIDVNISIFIRTCLALATPQLLDNPKLINFFSETVIPK